MKKVLVTMIVSVIVMMSLVSRGVAAPSSLAPTNCPSATPADKSCEECVSECSPDQLTGVTTRTTVQIEFVCDSSKTTYTCKCNRSYDFFCTRGYYGNPQSMGDTCTQCPDNATCDGEVVYVCGTVGTTDFTCDSDYYKNGTGCTACPDNATCDGVNFTCNSNYYKNETGCAACPDNATCNGVDFTCYDGFLKKETECSECPAGTYFENDQCNPCPSGTYRTDEMDKCETCPDYSTCDEDQSGFACVANSTITTDKKSCLCNPGYYPDNNRCIACDKGTYKSEAGNISCTQCDAPYEGVDVTTDSEAATSINQCKIESTEELEDDTGYYSYYPDGCSYGE